MKTLSFTVTDALMSAMGMKTLTGAGLIDASEDELAHFHVTLDVPVNAAASGNKTGEITLDDLRDELGLDTASSFNICTDIPIYATAIDASGAATDYLGAVVVGSSASSYLVTVDEDNPFKFTLGAEGKDTTATTVKLDFYVAFSSGVKTIEIEPNSFGGYFYVEADTLFRNETTGKDMAACLIFPKVKVQSAFTFTMAASGDPSTFDFVMDAFPARTKFSTKKVLVDMQIIENASSASETTFHNNVSSATHASI